jgi:hypothetical protein
MIDIQYKNKENKLLIIIKIRRWKNFMLLYLILMCSQIRLMLFGVLMKMVSRFLFESYKVIENIV